MKAILRTNELLKVSSLITNPKNARVHKKKQITQIAKSITKAGFVSDIVIDESNMILAGHGRLEAAVQLGMEEVPCLRLVGLSHGDKRAFVLADNKLVLNGAWDMEVLATELIGISESGTDPTETGFDQPEIDSIIHDFTEAAVTDDESDKGQIEPSAEEIVTRVGDTWLLGRHRLRCGDATTEDVDALMAGELADMVFTDAPYNCRIVGNVSGLGKHKHREFVQASGEMSASDYTAFLTTAFERVEHVCKNGAIVFACIDWRHLRELLAAGYAVFTELKNLCVWVKSNAGMGTFYRSQHELIFAWKVGDNEHTNNFGLGKEGRHRSNVWKYAGGSSFGPDRAQDLKNHPTVKNLTMVSDAIRDVSNRGEIVLDVFGGSGTTLIAAQKTGRRARLLELDPAYCDVTVRRWETLTGKHATLESDGLRFEDVCAERLSIAPAQEAAE